MGVGKNYIHRADQSYTCRLHSEWPICQHEFTPQIVCQIPGRQGSRPRRHAQKSTLLQWRCSSTPSQWLTTTQEQDVIQENFFLSHIKPNRKHMQLDKISKNQLIETIHYNLRERNHLPRHHHSLHQFSGLQVLLLLQRMTWPNMQRKSRNWNKESSCHRWSLLNPFNSFASEWYYWSWEETLCWRSKVW